MSDEVMVAIRRASLLNDLGRGAQALDQAKAAIAADPSNPGAYFEAARAALALHRYDEALGHADGGLALAPEDSFGRQLRAAVLVGQGKWEQARNVLMSVLDRRPNAASVHAQLARIAMHLGDHHAANRHAEKATTSSPDSADVWVLRSQVAHFNHDAIDALEHAERAVKCDPVNADALAAVAISELVREGTDLPRAAEMALAALRQEPARPELAALVRTVGWAVFQRGFPVGFFAGLIVGGVAAAPLTGTGDAVLGGVLTMVAALIGGLLPWPIQLLWIERRLPGVTRTWLASVLRR